MKLHHCCVLHSPLPITRARKFASHSTLRHASASAWWIRRARFLALCARAMHRCSARMCRCRRRERRRFILLPLLQHFFLHCRQRVISPPVVLHLRSHNQSILVTTSVLSEHFW